MPFKIWAVGEEVLAADFNDYVQEQTVATFANAAARSAALAAPNVGQLTFLSDTRVYHWWNGTAWLPLQGVLAYVEAVTPQTGIQGVTDLTGLVTPSLALPGGHRIRITAEVGFQKAGPDTSSWAELHIADGSNTSQIVRFASCPAPGWAAMTASRVLMPAAGNYVYKARAGTGGGFLNTQAAANSPNWLMVQDLGAP